jgi:hypothetical protein
LPRGAGLILANELDAVDVRDVVNLDRVGELLEHRHASHWYFVSGSFCAYARTHPADHVVGALEEVVSEVELEDVEVSPSGVWRILKRLDMSRLPASQRYRRHVNRWKGTRSPCPGTGSRSTWRSSLREATGSIRRSSTGCSRGVVIDDTGLFNVRLKEWEDFYNFHRPHGALGGQTPYERLREKTRAPAWTNTVSCTKVVLIERCATRFRPLVGAAPLVS